MQIYLSSVEINALPLKGLGSNSIKYCLISFYYLKEKDMPKILDICEHLLIDSGAHSIQHGKRVNFDEYTQKYKEFIAKYTDNPKIEGFFEMDIDNVVGYDKVLEYRKELESVSDKIIPVWHKNRGIDGYYKMCEEYSGKRISITGLKNIDIIYDQYDLFINAAHKFNCKIHILGLTRTAVLNEINLEEKDSTDSSSWVQNATFGNLSVVDGNMNMFSFSFLNGVKIKYLNLRAINLLGYLDMQKKYDELGEENG